MEYSVITYQIKTEDMIWHVRIQVHSTFFIIDIVWKSFRHPFFTITTRGDWSKDYMMQSYQALKIFVGTLITHWMSQ